MPGIDEEALEAVHEAQELPQEPRALDVQLVQVRVRVRRAVHEDKRHAHDGHVVARPLLEGLRHRLGRHEVLVRARPLQEDRAHLAHKGRVDAG